MNYSNKQMNTENSLLVTNIQRFSLHDGPGIRTTVFFKGCSLRCPWCSNPENISPVIQEYTRDGQKGLYGQYISADDLYKNIIKDKAFFDGPNEKWIVKTANELDSLPGGVTFSGGECLLQMRKIEELCNRLHKRSVHIAVETCLFVPVSNLEIALRCIDLFFVDIKIIGSGCKKYENGDLNLFLSNLERLMKWKDIAGNKKPVIVRIPVIGGFTDSRENRSKVIDLIKLYKDSILKIELIKEHNLGESKYRSLGYNITYTGVDDSLMDVYKMELGKIGPPVEICKI